MISNRLKSLKSMNDKDAVNLMFLLRSGNHCFYYQNLSFSILYFNFLSFYFFIGLLRNLGGICSDNLLTSCRTGTKHLIEEYVFEVVKKIYFLASVNDEELTNSIKIEYFNDLLKIVGRSALILHGGASFGPCHIGVARALYRAGMLPKIICGSFVGAIVAAILCTKDKDELEDLFDNENIEISAFNKREKMGGSSLQRKLSRLFKYGRIFDISILGEFVRNNMGDITFAEAFQKTGYILNITVYSKRKNEVPVLLNHLTSPEVVIWSAACASCSVPGLYEPINLLAKDSNGKIFPWTPSGIRLEAAEIISPNIHIQRLTELFNVNNFIVSQVPSYWSWRAGKTDVYKKSWYGELFRIIGREIRHRLWQIKEIGLLPQSLIRIEEFFETSWTGDILFKPIIFFSDIQYIFSNPTPQFIHYCIEKGEYSVWRRMTNLEIRCAIEFATEDALVKLNQQKHDQSNSDPLFIKDSLPLLKRAKSIQ